MKITGVMCFVILFSWTETVAHADLDVQPVIADNRNVIYTDLGVDDSLLTWSLGYARFLPLSSVRRVLILYGEYSIPMAEPDFHDFRVRAGLRLNLVQHRWFALPIALTMAVRGTENTLFTAVGIGTELGIVPGYYASIWFAAAEIFWDQQWETHLENSDRYRQFTYKDARDGWYSIPALSVRFGARVGGLLWRHFGAALRGGYEWHGLILLC
jgi:hypothetical protein